MCDIELERDLEIGQWHDKSARCIGIFLTGALRLPGSSGAV
jgi:hypothetical protein